MLFPYLVFPWFLVVLLLSLNPVTGSRLDALSDGILCRPINRWEYLLSSWFARVLVVVAAFVIVIVPAVLVVVAADRPLVAEDSVTGYGVTASIAVVMLVLTFLTSLGFFAGTLLKNPLFAAAVLILFWIPVNRVLHTFSLEEFSPISLNQSLPTLLRTAWSEDDSADPDDMANLRAAVDQASDFLSTLTGQSAPKPNRSPEFYERGDYTDFSLTRVFLGYGIPTIVCLGLTTWIFCRRDL